MAEKRWYVVGPESGKPEELVWTVSREPDEEGWETDSFYPGYGLSRDLAEELADAANAAWDAKQRSADTRNGRVS